VATAAATQVNLAGYLAQAERGDLAALPVQATLKDGLLSLSGVVSLTSQRLELVELAAAMPGVAEVNAIDLVVRLPEVYIVADGDTLWTIAYYLYGDGTRWEDVYAANQELLGNSVLLDVGMELQVPER
ncbi:MAG: LysM peptidoglycan-binding domain-containing protein, partial [Caldilineaceae bacterium]